MAAQFCSHCGAPLAPGAQFCAHCGTPVAAGPAAAAGAPLATGAYPPMAYPPYAAAPPPRRSRVRRWIIVAIVVVIVVAVVGFVYFEFVAPNVEINAFIISAPTNVCGLNEEQNALSYLGFNDTPGTQEELEFPVPNNTSAVCTISSVITNTSGFTINNVGIPLTIPANQTGNLWMNLTIPGSSWSGNVYLIFT